MRRALGPSLKVGKSSAARGVVGGVIERCRHVGPGVWPSFDEITAEREAIGYLPFDAVDSAAVAACARRARAIEVRGDMAQLISTGRFACGTCSWVCRASHALPPNGRGSGHGDDQ